MKLEDIKMHPTSGLATSMYMTEVVHSVKNGELTLREDDFQKLLETAHYHVYREGWSKDYFSGSLIQSSFEKEIRKAVEFLLAIELPIEKIKKFREDEFALFMKARQKR